MYRRDEPFFPHVAGLVAARERYIRSATAVRSAVWCMSLKPSVAQVTVTSLLTFQRWNNVCYSGTVFCTLFLRTCGLSDTPRQLSDTFRGTFLPPPPSRSESAVV